MISNHWIALRKESWTRLETLAQQVETSSLKTLSSAALREFDLLYRQAAADLSAVRSMKYSFLAASARASSAQLSDSVCQISEIVLDSIRTASRCRCIVRNTHVSAPEV